MHPPLPDILRLNIPSTLVDVDEACHKAQLFLTPKRHVRDQFFVLLALREALTNAVRHGNRGDPNLSVECLIAVCENELVMSIRDQGQGFDWRAHGWELPDPQSESGRGLAIIKTCFDGIEFNEQGNEITFRKKLDLQGGDGMSKMDREGPEATVAVKEDLVGSKIESVRQELANLINNGVLALTIDLNGVGIVDSLGMGLLVATHNSLKAKGGRLMLINVAPKIHDVLTIMRLDRHFSINRAA